MSVHRLGGLNAIFIADNKKGNNLRDYILPSQMTKNKCMKKIKNL